MKANKPKVSRLNKTSLKRFFVEALRYLFFISFLAALGGLVYFARLRGI